MHLVTFKDTKKINFLKTDNYLPLIYKLIFDEYWPDTKIKLIARLKIVRQEITILWHYLF